MAGHQAVFDRGIFPPERVHGGTVLPDVLRGDPPGAVVGGGGPSIGARRVVPGAPEEGGCDRPAISGDTADGDTDW